MNFDDLLRQSRDAEPFSQKQLEWMLALPPDSAETYQLMCEAKRISRELTGDKMEVHAQFALNLAPCPKNCKYCSFAAVNKVFTEPIELTLEEVQDSALLLEEQGAAAVYMMATANYPFERIMEMGREVRARLKQETVLVANIGDQDLPSAKQMVEAGFNGVYHALRLREGIDTAIKPELRHKSFAAFKEAGLSIGTCVEPVGPEHANAEIAERILFTGSLDPAYSGAARRISIPGTEMAIKYGMISELRMSQIVAVTRLGLPRSVLGNCTHEPCTIGAAAGANLFWAEIGANPRDIKEKTEEGRGFTVDKCRELFWEAGCGVLDGPSVYYQKR